ncbi:MAG: hypothetical protein WKG07_41455 [Hymenobacter sp.]
MAKSKFLPALLADMPFLRLSQGIPLELEPEEASLLRGTFDQLLAEYTGTKSGRIDMITTYLQVYLLQIRRIYERPARVCATRSDRGHAERFGNYRTISTLAGQGFRTKTQALRNSLVKYSLS